MKTQKPNPQKDCITFEDAFQKMKILQQEGMLVKYFKLLVVSPEGNKLTLTFDPSTLRKPKG